MALGEGGPGLRLRCIAAQGGRIEMKQVACRLRPDIPDFQKEGIAVWRHWLSLLIGIWLFLSPWVIDLASRTATTWNYVVMGILVFLLSIVELSGGGRRSAP